MLLTTTRVGHCHVPFFLNSAKRASAFVSEYDLAASSDDSIICVARFRLDADRLEAEKPSVDFISSSSRLEQAPRIPVRCSMDFWPACEASRADTNSGRCPAKTIPRFFASSAIAKYASRGRP